MTTARHNAIIKDLTPGITVACFSDLLASRTGRSAVFARATDTVVAYRSGPSARLYPF